MRNIAVKLLISLGIATIFFSIFLLYQTYSLTNRRVREVIKQQASMALKFDLAIREYIAKNVRSVMYELLGPDAFMPETMSTSYVARSIFEDVRNEFPDYIIKFASDNPRNPANQAGPEELKVIEYLNNNPQSQRWEGAISITGKPYFAKFSAMRMDESCLRCHGNPDDAPAALLERYGSTAGFHRPLGKIIGLDTVAIPMAKISEKLWPELLKTFLVSALGLLLFFLFIVSTTRLLITNRLTMISRHFVTSAQQSDYLQIKPLEIKGKDEICDLAVSFNTLSDKLKHFYSSLEMQVKERTRELENTNVQLRQEIGERKRAEEALRESQTEFRNLASHLQEISENERKAIAREIHDEVGQAMTALKMDISSLADSVGDNMIMLNKIGSMAALINSTLSVVRRLQTELRPHMIDDLGLGETIRWQLSEFEKRSKVFCSIDISADIDSLGEKPSITLFRVMQEALTNIARHAEAGNVHVAIREENGKIAMEIKDDGKGIDPEKIRDSRSFGILSMRERVTALGGSLEISGEPGKGTVVTAKISGNGGE